MDLLTFLRVLLRRWDVVLPGCILTVVTVLTAGASVAPAHEAQGSLLLLGPARVEDGPVNPYLVFNSSLGQTAVIIAEAMRSEEVVRDLADIGATAGYEVEPTEKSPILTVTARGTSREQVLNTSQLVLQRVQDDLVRRQQEAGAPADTFIRSQVLSPPRASMHSGSRPRVMAAVGALGVGLTVMLAFAVESLAAWRSRRHSPSGAPTWAGPVLADYPQVPSEPQPHFEPHFEAERERVEVPESNGWHREPPSGPLVDVVVGTPGVTPAEDPIEAQPFEAQGAYEAQHFEAGDFTGATFDEGLPENEVPARNGSLEQHDGLVDAWWSAWERRQAGRRAEDPMVAPSHDPVEDWAGEAAEAGDDDAVTSSPRDMLEDDAAADPWWDEDRDQAEGLLAWGGRIEVLGGTPDVEPVTPRRPFLPRDDRDGGADQPLT